MYHFNSRVSYSILGSDGKLSIPGVVNYFQDVCLFHSHDVGVGLDVIKKRHCAWLLSSWHIMFYRFPTLGERVIVNTCPYEFKSIYGMRSFALQTEDGEYLAVADSNWFMFDSERMRPVRAPKEELEAYGTGARYDMPKAPRKIALPKGETFVETCTVYQNQLDTNQHVNNGEYVRISCNYIPDNLDCSELRVEYKNAAHLGDTIYVFIAETPEYFYVILKNEAGELYTISEFRKNRF